MTSSPPFPNEPCRRSRYPSDLTDRQWSRVQPLLPGPRHTGRKPVHAWREVLDALNYRWETGCAWRMLPHDFPPWGTVYAHFRRWQRSGVLRQVREALERRDQHRERSRQSAPSPTEADDCCDPDHRGVSSETAPS